MKLRKITAITSASIFIVWILPLGIFIKPDKEKMACGGQRAICLCRHLLVKRQAKHAGEIILKNFAPQPQKESTRALSHYYESTKPMDLFYRNWENIIESERTVLSRRITRAIEHVPKQPAG